MRAADNLIVLRLFLCAYPEMLQFDAEGNAGPEL